MLIRNLFFFILSALYCYQVYAATIPNCASAFLSQDLDLREIQTTWEKPETLPVIDEAGLQEFETNLEFLASVKPGELKIQCYSDCTAAAYTTYMEHFAKRSLSVNYIAAITQRIKFMDNLNGKSKTIVLGTPGDDSERAINSLGIVPEDFYPSRFDINTPELIKSLNLVANRFRELKSDTPNIRRKQLKEEATAIANEIIQHFYGPFPKSNVFLGQDFKSPQHLAARSLPNYMKKGAAFFKYDIYEVDELIKAADFTLEHDFPILLVYEHQADDFKEQNGVYHDATLDPISTERHMTVLNGVAKHKKNHRTYYRIQNAHAGSYRHYMSKSYLLKTFKRAKIIMPTELWQGLLDHIDSY